MIFPTLDLSKEEEVYYESNRRKSRAAKVDSAKDEIKKKLSVVRMEKLRCEQIARNEGETCCVQI
jgi:hypothetical protein